MSVSRKLWKSALRFAFWFPTSILAVACASTEKTADAPKPDHYVLENGPVVPASSPFPDQHPIYAKIYAGDQLLERRLVYRGWDMDHDGKIDMLEYLDPQGRVIRKSYDFNHDGGIELDQR